MREVTWKKLRRPVAEILKNNGAQAAQNRQHPHPRQLLSMDAPGDKAQQAQMGHS